MIDEMMRYIYISINDLGLEELGNPYYQGGGHFTFPKGENFRFERV